MSTVEFLCFIRHFSLLIGHTILTGDKARLLYLRLRDLVNNLTTPRSFEVHYPYVEEKTSEFLQHYKEIFNAELFLKCYKMFHSVYEICMHRHLKAIFFYFHEQN